MKKLLVFLMAVPLGAAVSAQDIAASKVPAPVKAALTVKYPKAAKVSWEIEKGNYEANWGGRSGEDNSATFTPAGTFVEIVVAIPVTDLPKDAIDYVHEHYQGKKITEAGKVTSADGKLSYEAEVKGKDLLFTADGAFIRID